MEKFQDDIHAKIFEKEYQKLKKLNEELESEKVSLDGQKRRIQMRVNELEADKILLQNMKADLAKKNMKLEKINNNLSIWQNAVLHEQKNMFSEIYNQIYSIKNSPDSKHLEYAVKKTEMIEQEFHDLLRWSRNFVKETKPDYQMFQFCSVINGLSNIYEYYGGKKDIIVTPKIFNVHSDKVLLKFIFHNIIKNVLNIVRNNALIRINISKKNGFYLFEILDNGPGFSGFADETDIFPAVKKGNGLMIIEKCTEILKGKISLYNLAAGGCQYKLQIPAYNAGSK